MRVVCVILSLVAAVLSHRAAQADDIIRFKCQQDNKNGSAISIVRVSPRIKQVVQSVKMKAKEVEIDKLYRYTDGSVDKTLQNVRMKSLVGQQESVDEIADAELKQASSYKQTVSISHGKIIFGTEIRMYTIDMAGGGTLTMTNGGQPGFCDRLR